MRNKRHKKKKEGNKMNIIFEVNIRAEMIRHIEKEQHWIAKVKEKFPEMPKRHLDKLINDNKNFEIKKAEIQAEIDKIEKGEKLEMRKERFARFAGIEVTDLKNRNDKVLFVMSYDFVSDSQINIIVMDNDRGFPVAYLADRHITVQEVFDRFYINDRYRITKTHNTYDTIKVTI